MTREEKAKARMDKTGQRAAKALNRAVDALNAYRVECMGTDRAVTRADDTRITLAEKMAEYGNYLGAVHADKGRGA